MKKIMVIIMAILLSGLANAIYSGETVTIAENIECDELLVKISVNPFRGEEEFVLVPDCAEVSFEDNIKTFRCICTGSRTTLNITTDLTAMGNYSFEIDQYRMVEEQEQSSSSSSSSSSGGGGGGMATVTMQTGKPRVIFMLENKYSRLKINGIDHTLRIIEIRNGSVMMEFKSEPILFEVFLGKEKSIDIDGDNVNDIMVKLLEIRRNFARIELTKLEEVKEVVIEEAQIEEIVEEEEIVIPEDITAEEIVMEEPKSNTGLFIAIGGFAVIAMIAVIYFFNKGKKKEED